MTACGLGRAEQVGTDRHLSLWEFVFEFGVLSFAQVRLTMSVLPEKTMTPDKKNDVSYSMQFVGLLLGVCFLVLGAFRAEEFLKTFLAHSSIYFGVCWLFIALIHRMKWLHKIELDEARDLQSRLLATESEEQNKTEKPTTHRQ